MIRITSRAEILSSLQVGGVSPLDSAEELNDTSIACILRRLAGVACPATRARIRKLILSSLRLLSLDQSSLEDRVEAAIDGLLATGDLVATSAGVISDFDEPDDMLYLAPPSFLRRKSGTVVIFGIAIDNVDFLPDSFQTRIRYVGVSRLIVPIEDDLPARLTSLGLREVSRDAWSAPPKAQEPEEVVRFAETILERDGSHSHVPEATVLDLKPGGTYRRGWSPLAEQTGLFIARRPRTYGAPLWCLVKLSKGQVARILDLPFRDSHQRACDAAWYLQHALNAARGACLEFAVSSIGGDVFLNFVVPIPLWAQRRLLSIGETASPMRGHAMAFRLSHVEYEAEKDFLGTHLWLTPVEP